MDHCAYWRVCPCYHDAAPRSKDGKCVHLYIQCKLALVYQLQEKFSWPTEQCDGTPTKES